MKVKILKSLATAKGAYTPNAVVEVEDEIADKWITSGHAALYEQPLEMTPTHGYGVPITTVHPRSYAEYTKEQITAMNAKEQHEFIEKYELAVEGYKKSMKATELEHALLLFLGYSRVDSE